MTERSELQPLLFSIAYRMLGSVAEAEDVVQESFLRHERARQQGTEIESSKAFLTTVTTRLAIDQLRSARSRRDVLRAVAARAARDSFRTRSGGGG